ncbi:PREDICTED: transcriptional adapter 3-like [Dipodomys ordii]|uniref:Transcriptional adapter 3 n=1 Tax=Dipodomys ordii TaxID=10020 RepID=A0A1S3EQS5_DIPOR|nr:PREDICTED: transcriptional adapter 3-like [Dipodomys ordii]
MSELKDCPLQFHDFKSVDHLKVCPRYTAVLARSEDDGIGIEELDTLQLELETLLSSASRRLRVLEAETQILTDWQDKKGDRRFLKLGRDHELGAPPKHGKPKKQKLEGKMGHGPGPGPGRPKSKNLQPKIQEYEFTDDPIDVPRIPKNDAPNRFWASVEPYCADITSEEVRTLEELLKPPEDEAEHYKVETPRDLEQESSEWPQDTASKGFLPPVCPSSDSAFCWQNLPDGTWALASLMSALSLVFLPSAVVQALTPFY